MPKHTYAIFGFNDGVEELINHLEEELGPDLEARAGKADATEPHCTIDCRESVKLIDRFRDKVSAYYGFKHTLIEPVYVADPDDPLKDCAFNVLGIGYEVKNTKLTCTGEVKSYER